MSLTIITSPPPTSDFTPLEEHQAQTPGTFFGGKPVLYHHCAGAELRMSNDQISTHPAIERLVGNASNGTANGENAPRKIHVPQIDVWVGSDNLTLFNTAISTGVEIHYPSIMTHGRESITGTSTGPIESVYVELLLNDTSYANSEDDFLSLPFNIIPPTSDTATPSFDNANGSITTPAQKLFNAIATCQDLHPDPNDSGEEDEGGHESTAPGAGGWITAENAHMFTDEGGEFAGATILGPGAGTVRQRGESDEGFEDAEEETEAGANAEGVDGDETKWRRIG